MKIKYKIFKYYDYLKIKKRNLFENIIFLFLDFLREGKRYFIETENPAWSKIYLGTQSVYKKITGDKYRFLSFHDSIELLEDLSKKIDNDYDVIVGIPRSGLLFANLLSLKMALPLSVPEMLSNNIWKSKVIEAKKIKKVLLVDDSIVSGKTMNKALEMISGEFAGAKIDKAVLVATEETKNLVDYYSVLVPKPRFFEWNMMHAKKGSIAVDLDGVLCEDPPQGLVRDEEAFLEWLEKARSYMLPAFEIDYIISNRFERHRDQTEEWLKKNKVKYRELVLSQAGNKDEQKTIGVEHKVREIIKRKPSIYWESSRNEARLIAKRTSVPILCIEDKKMY